MSLFQEGINQINEHHYFGPTEFLQYCRDIDFKPKGTTAQYISLDFYEKLPKELKDNKTIAIKELNPIILRGIEYLRVNSALNA